MIGFEYKYIKYSEIFQNFKISTFDLVYLTFGVILLCVIIFVFAFYILPFIKIYFQYKSKIKNDEKKRKMIKKISLQKEINEKIEKELNIG